jgi:hypothetical protein
MWVYLSHENFLPLFDSHVTPEATYLITLYSPARSLLGMLKREGTPGGTDRHWVHVSPGHQGAAVPALDHARRCQAG